METWDELETLLDELRAANEQWRASVEGLTEQLAAARAVGDKLDQFYADLGVLDALLTINRRIFNESGRLHTARSDYGLTRVAALIWHSVEDPRPELAAAPPEGMYSIEVRLGPRYLLGVSGGAIAPGDERLYVLIQGEKQLLAPLPTSRERFRAALLRAFAAPGYSGPARVAGEHAEAAAGVSTDQPSGTEANRATEDGAEAEATASASTNGSPQTAATPQPEQPPHPDEPPDVIELPGSRSEDQP
jgi:hypothetical protein